MNNTGSGQELAYFLQRFKLQRGLIFGLLIISALLAFEAFNYSTTEFALHDVLGNLTFASLQWSTILAIAFCGIDFAGIARLFTPQEGAVEPNEVWYLFGAWILAATMNAALTWWGVSLAILDHQSMGTAIIDQTLLLRIVPIFVAVMVWLIRVLIIGTFSVAGDRLFTQSAARSQVQRSAARPYASRQVGGSQASSPAASRPSGIPSANPAFRSNRPVQQPLEPTYTEVDPPPTQNYHPVTASPRTNMNQTRR